MHHGAVVVTPNNRLSNQLLSEYYAYSPSFASNPIILKKPRCIPYQAFLKQLFQQIRHQYTHLTHPMVLSSTQQRQLWRYILDQQSQYPCNDGLLNAIQDAWARCQHWNISADHPDFLHKHQTKQFQQWQHLFQDMLDERHALTEEQLVNYIVNYDIAKTADNIIWVCFDSYTPQQLALQTALELQNYQQYHYDLAEKTTLTYHYPAQDQADEYQQMILWAKSRLAAGDQHIALIIPDLKSQASTLQRLLQRHFSHNQYNMSLGKKLTQFPLIAHALQWLQLDKDRLSNHQMRLLLHSPFIIAGKTEFLARSDVLQQSNLLRERLIPFNLFTQTLQTKSPLLVNALQQLDDYPEQASALEWINHFKQRLTHLGFPGENVLDSASYQCFQRLLALFDEFLEYGVITSTMDSKQALEALCDLAKNTVFQLKQPSTPIVVLGLLEASGCTFDSIWITGLTDQCLPQKTNLSAFIPIELQRKLLMPHATVERELQLATQLLQRLQHACESIVMSYPRLTSDMPNLPSPLVPDTALFKPFDTLKSTDTSALITQNESYVFPLLPDEQVRGGTTLLANQAKCPFRAFAAHRLHANAPQDISEGLDASERGQIVHRIMELLWQQLGSQEKLISLTAEALNQYLEPIIVATLKPYAETKSISFSPIIQGIEFQRLKHLIELALEWEKQRPEFVVDALEHTFTTQLAGLDFQVRVDRLDKIKTDDNQDSKIVIDYKSNLPSSKPWNEERPESPQLLLYALLDEHINTLLFIQFKTGQFKCSGLSEEAMPIKGIQALKKDEQWAAYQQQWHEQLGTLAQEFKTGQCIPQPNKTSTCSQCSFQNLCRIS